MKGMEARLKKQWLIVIFISLMLLIKVLKNPSETTEKVIQFPDEGKLAIEFSIQWP